eukprot:Phypoly_transcript_17909.p1 GENE.Phypoly_transcript_17909~~Phypoly_transcript_17909.p1  ORF type:complete len:188 (+),score=17.08 Phypoly_transcript_17909:178-741(+)
MAQQQTQQEPQQPDPPKRLLPKEHDTTQFKEGAKPLQRLTHEERVARGYVGRSFVSGSKKFKLDYFWNTALDVLFGTVEFNHKCEGPPGSAHGGSIAAILDDSMSQASYWHLTDESNAKNLPMRRVVTGTLQIKYGIRIPLTTPIISVAYVQSQVDRKVFVRGVLTNEQGEIYAEGTGVWIILKPNP